MRIRLVGTLAAAMLMGTTLISAQPDAAPAAADEAVTGEARIAPMRAPEGWRAEDTQVAPGRWTVEVARFPSTALAEGVRASLATLGWEPVEVHRGDDGAQVIFGTFAQVLDAHAVARELSARQLAEPRVVRLPEGALRVDARLRLPDDDPFQPMVRANDEALTWDAGLASVREFVSSLLADEREAAAEALEQIESAETNASDKGAAALTLMRAMRDKKRNADGALVLALRLARGHWPTATDADRLEAGELASDLFYGHRRDWMAAWRTTRVLVDFPARDRDGRTRDRLRRIALAVDLVREGTEPAPSWTEIRGLIRRAFDNAGPADRKNRARLELVYLQTFAWEGRWDRVEELAAEMTQRYPESSPETVMARVLHARSLERRSEYTRALALLDRALTMVAASDDTFHLGFEPLDLRGVVLDQRSRLARLEATGGVEE